MLLHKVKYIKQERVCVLGRFSWPVQGFSNSPSKGEVVDTCFWGGRFERTQAPLAWRDEMDLIVAPRPRDFLISGNACMFCICLGSEIDDFYRTDTGMGAQPAGVKR